MSQKPGLSLPGYFGSSVALVGFTNLIQETSAGRTDSAAVLDSAAVDEYMELTFGVITFSENLSGENFGIFTITVS